MNRFESCLVLASILFFLVAPAAGIEILSPDTEYSNNSTLTVKVNNTTGLDNFNYTVEADEERVNEAGFNAQDSGDVLLNNSHNISDLETGEEVNVTVNAYDGSSKVSNSTAFNLDFDGPNYSIHNPVENTNTSGILGLNISDKDYTDLNISYKIENVDGSYSDVTLADSIDLTSKTMSVGDYTVNFWIKDAAGNEENESIDFTFDDQQPAFNGEFSSGDYLNESVKFEDSFTNTTSGLKSSNYSIEKNGQPLHEDLEGLTFGEKHLIGDHTNHSKSYDLRIIAEDYAGNMLNKTYSFTTDFLPPNFQRSYPEDLDFNASGGQTFSIAFKKGDSLSAISDNSFISVPQEKLYVKDSLNEVLDYFHDNSEDVGEVSFDLNGLEGVYNTSRIDDSTYEIVVGAKDEAGNLNKTVFEMSVSNHAPNFSSVEYEGDELEGGDVIGDGSISVETDWSGVDIKNLTYDWGSGKNAVGDGSFDVGVDEGDYDLELVAEDFNGNTNTKTFNDITVDRSPPDIQLTRETDEGWKDSHEVKVECTSDGSNISGISVYASDEKIQGWEDGTEETFELERQGKTNYDFRCRDKAGNVGNKTMELSVDSNKPTIDGFVPGEDEENVKTSLTFKIELDEESVPSGVDVSATNISSSEGEFESWAYNEGVLSSKISDLPYSSSVTVTGTVVDDIGNEREFETSFITEGEPADWIKVADKMEAEEEMVLGVMRTDIGSNVGEVDIDIQDSDTIREFDFKRSESGEASVMIVEDNSVPEDLEGPEGSVYRFVGIETGNLSSENIISSNLTFEVQSDWVNSNGGVDSLEVARNQGEGWEKINSSIEETEDSVTVSATVEDFSWFAVRTRDAGSSSIASMIPKTDLNIGDLVTVGLLAAISMLVLYLLDLMGLFAIPLDLTKKI